MDRRTLQELAHVRLEEARRLMHEGFPSGAYYLGGYSVELALKACFAKSVAMHEFPEKGRVLDAHTHNLEKLLVLVGLDEPLRHAGASDRALDRNWGTVKDWRETARYEPRLATDAALLLNAIDDPHHGVLAWLSRYW